jgi:hypothetical protein
VIEIPLTQGKVALVDDEDAGIVMSYKWYAIQEPRSGRPIWYAVRSIGNRRDGYRQIRMHRAILNAPAGVPIDHENGDGLDNRRGNISITTHAANIKNSYRRRDGLLSSQQPKVKLARKPMMPTPKPGQFLRKRGDRWYWEPSRAARLLGFKCVALGADATAAAELAKPLHRDYEAKLTERLQNWDQNENGML